MSTTKSKDTDDYIEETRENIETYTAGFTGDIGREFKRLDRRLERALDADDNDDLVDELDDAQDDLRGLVNRVFTGKSPSNFQQLVEQPLERAIESAE